MDVDKRNIPVGKRRKNNGSEKNDTLCYGILGAH